MEKLTDREREALRLASDGLQQKQIAYIMGITAKTVDAHLHRARFKLHARNTVHMVAIAFRSGILCSLAALSAIGLISSSSDMMRPARLARTSVKTVRTGRSARREWVLRA